LCIDFDGYEGVRLQEKSARPAANASENHSEPG
jgi:hypothetical protein